MTKREQQEKLFCAIGYVGDDLIQRADAPVEARRTNTAWVKWAALAACCVLVIGLASRLPLFGAKSSAPETTTMTMDAPAAAAEAKSEAPQMTEESAEEAAPAEAEEAPAEAPAAENRESGAAGSDAIGNGEAANVDAALQKTLLETQLGPVTLGMPAEDVRSLLGEPEWESDELYVCTDKGDFRYLLWKYNPTNDPNYLHTVVLDFADAGDGFVLNDIQTFGASGWALPSGLKVGCSVDDVLAVYPDAALKDIDGESFDGSPLGSISLEAGHVRLTFLVEGETVTSISLGTYYEDPGWVDETDCEEPAYSFASSDIVVYQKNVFEQEGDTGWFSYHMKDKAAKKLEVVLGIQELVPIEKAPEPRYYLDFQNGTVVMLGDDRLSGAVYTCEDLTGFRAAMETGEDPTPHLTCITVCDFPAGTDEALLELTICRYAAEG